MKLKIFYLVMTILCLNQIYAQVSTNGDQLKDLLVNKNVMGEAYWELWTPELQAEIDRNIEKYRKAEAVIKLKGVPEGTVIKVEQLDHDFQFGSNIFNFDQLGSTELNNKYKNAFESLFNSATIPFYWRQFEPEPDRARYKSSYRDSEVYWNQLKEPWNDTFWRRPSPENIIKFCEENNINMHGHPMVYANSHVNPLWVEPENVNEMERLMKKRIIELCQYYKDRIPSWDIVNESVNPMKDIPRYYNVLPEDYTYKFFKLAEEELPSSVNLCINDSWRPVYPSFINELIKRGAKIDVVGLQMHIFGSKPCLDIADGKTVYPNNTSWKPNDIINYLETLDSLERPIHISEITIPSPGNAPIDNEIQAILTRNFYRLWFSWPSVYRITWWNMVDECGKPGEPNRSGIFTRLMEPKPAFFALDKLINDEWKTRITVSATKGGVVKFRGFKGKYRIKWKNSAGDEEHVEFYLKNDGNGTFVITDDILYDSRTSKDIVASDEDNRIPILNGANEGYICYEEQPPTPFPDYYYLYPVPTNEIILSKGEIKQNPGWE